MNALAELPVEATEAVDLQQVPIPDDYHCSCEFCQLFYGVLMRSDGSYYRKTDRRKYYRDEESDMATSHIAKTPLHVARWAIQEFTEPGDWVFDPTMGAGTTGVEALVQGRKAVGIEIEFAAQLTMPNMEKHGRSRQDFFLFSGDARQMDKMIPQTKLGEQPFQLIVNNPPYSGDEHAAPIKNKHGEKIGRYVKKYDRDIGGNLAFLKEGPEYYEVMGLLYAQAWQYLKVGGHLVIAVKDMMRSREHYLLHKYLAETVQSHIPTAVFQGVALLPHWPRTLAISAYEKRYGIKAALYQTIMVFKKAFSTTDTDL